MSRKTTKADKTRRSGRSTVTQMRHQTVMAKALAGKRPTEIAAEVGLSRQTVSEILNSKEMKEKVSQINAKLAAGIDAAIAVVLRAAGKDYYAARDLLQNFGFMKQKVDLGFRMSLEDLVLGSMNENKKYLKGE